MRGRAGDVSVILTGAAAARFRSLVRALVDQRAHSQSGPNAMPGAGFSWVVA